MGSADFVGRGGGPDDTALVIVGGGDLTLHASAATLRAVILTIRERGLYPSVLVDPNLDGPVIDELQLAGVPVMVPGPVLTDRTRRRRLAMLSELVHWLRTSEARVVYVLSDDRRRASMVRIAQRMAPRVGDVVELAPSANMGG